jgi:hypothetical protein
VRQLFIVILSVVMLGVVMLGVVVLGVMAPKNTCFGQKWTFFNQDLTMVLKAKHSNTIKNGLKYKTFQGRNVL